MKVAIHTLALWNFPGDVEKSSPEARERAVDRFEARINDDLKRFGDLTDRRVRVEWLQTSAASQNGFFTQLTAIVTTGD